MFFTSCTFPSVLSRMVLRVETLGLRGAFGWSDGLREDVGGWRCCGMHERVAI